MSCNGPITLSIMTAGDNQHISDGTYFCDGYAYDNTYTCYMSSTYKAIQGSESNSTWEQVGESDCPGQARYSRQHMWITLGYGSSTRNGSYVNATKLNRVVSPDGYLVTEGLNNVTANASSSLSQILYPDDYYRCSLGRETVTNTAGYQQKSITDDCGETITNFNYIANYNRQVAGADGSSWEETISNCQKVYSPEGGQYIGTYATSTWKQTTAYGEVFEGQGLIPCGIPVCHPSTPGCVVEESLSNAQSLGKIKGLLSAALEKRLLKMKENTIRTCTYNQSSGLPWTKYMCSNNEDPTACWTNGALEIPFLYTEDPTTFEDQYAVRNQLSKLRLSVKNKNLPDASNGVGKAGIYGKVKIYVPNFIGFGVNNYPISSSQSPCCRCTATDCAAEYTVLYEGDFGLGGGDTDPEKYIYFDIPYTIDLRQISEQYPPVVVDEYPHGYPIKACVQI